MKPPLRIVAEYGRDPEGLPALQKSLEDKIKAILTVSATVQLVPPGTLPRYEMKGQLIRKVYEE